MSDTNLTTSIQAIRTKILNDITTATVDQLLSLSRAAKSVGLTEDSDIENAVNSRVNALSSGATTEEMVKLSNAIKQVRNSSQSALSPSATSDDIVEGTTNKFMSDANLQALGSAIIPATDATHDLGSPTNKFRDLYLDNNTLYFGTTQFTSDDILNFDLSVQPETLEIQVSADEAGHGTHWDWTWTQSALPYARTAITETPLSVVPLYMQGTYQINNFANTQYGSMTQTHSFKLKWIEGAGNDNLVSWATTTTVNHSHPDINGGNSTSVERLAVNVPSTITPPTLTAPSVTYTVGSTTGAYVFSGTAMGNNPEIGPFYRGGTYTININASGHPFYFTTDNGTNFASNTYFGEYTSGVTGSRTDNGTITFTVPAGAPDVLYYQCGVHGAMRGTIRVKDLAVETNANGNYLIYGQHTQEGHAQTIELRPIPTLTSQMCLVYDSSTNKFVPQDLSTYVENTPAFENKIKEVAGTATLIAPDGTSLVASVNIYSDATYLPAVGNTVGDIAFVEDTQKLYIYKATGWIETVANADLTGLATETFVQNYVANNSPGGGNVVEYTSTNTAATNDIVMLNTDGTVTVVEPTNYPFDQQTAIDSQMTSGYIGDSNYRGMIAHHSTREKGMLIFPGGTGHNDRTMLVVFSRNGSGISKGTPFSSGEPINNFRDQHAFFGPAGTHEDKFLYLGAATSGGNINVGTGNITGTTVNTTGTDSSAAYSNTTNNGQLNIGLNGRMVVDHGGFNGTVLTFYVKFENSNNKAAVRKFTYDFANQNLDHSFPEIETSSSETFEWEHTAIDPSTPTRIALYRQEGVTSTRRGIIKFADVDWDAGTINIGPSADLFTRSGSHNVDAWEIQNKQAFHPTNGLLAAVTTSPPDGGGDAPYRLKVALYSADANLSITNVSGNLTLMNGANVKVGTVRGNIAWTKGSNTGSTPNAPILITPIISNQTGSSPQTRYLQYDNSGNYITQTTDSNTFDSGSMWTYSSPFNDGDTASYSPDTVNSLYPQVIMTQGPYGESNFDATKLHGVAASAGTTIDVTLEYGIHTGLSGLTTGSKYFVTDSGGISTSGAAKLGTAINATSLALDFTDELTSTDLGTYATKAYVGQQITAAGSYSDASVDTHLNQNTATSNEVLSWNGTDYEWVAQPTNNNQLTNGANYITAADVPNANTVEYTSTSSASVDDVVMLNSDGTVTPVEPTSYPVNSQIALSTIGSAHGDNSPHHGLGMIAHKPTDRNSGMVVYRDQNNENHTISSFTASGGSFSISSTATVNQSSDNMKLYPFFDPFDDTKVLLLYTRFNQATCRIVDTAANGSITVGGIISLGQLGSTSSKHFEVDMVNSTSGDVKIICSVPGYVTQLTWDGTNITAGTPIATTNNGYHRFSLGQDGLFAMISGTSLRAGKVDWAGGTVSEGASLTVTDNGNQAYAVSESGKIAYAFYDGNATKISTFSIDSSTYACTLLHTSDAIDNRYNSGTPRPHDIMFAPGGESFGYSWYGSDRQNASSSDNKAILGTVASNGTITFIATTNSSVGQMYSFFPTGQADTAYRFLAASEWSNSMSQKGLVGFYSLKFNNYNPISQLRLLDLPYSESNLNVSKIHGLAASSGTTIDVTTENGIHTGLSGLTVGSKYYVLDNGTLSTSPDSNNAKIGLAITSTSLALDFTDELTDASLATYATKSYVTTQVANLVDSAPATLDTLNELAAALGDDANFSTTITNSLANKLESSDLNGYATETYVGDQITAAGSYSDASVDTHLNQNTATTGQILTWNGTDYAWVDASSSISVSETAPASPSSGDMWFNSADGNTYMWYSDGDSNQWIQLNGTGTVVQNITNNNTVFGNPTITSVSPNNFDGSSGTVITIQGTNFDVGTVVSFIDANGVETNASATSIVTQGELTATIPQAYTSAEGPLDVKVTVGDGQTITSTDAIQTGGSPTWTTAAGQLGSSLYKDQTGVSLQIEATDPDGQFVSYEIGSGSLAPGLSLAAGTGLITGDITTASVTADTNYSFTANANDTSGNSTPRTFFINVLNSLLGDPYTWRFAWSSTSDYLMGFDYGRGTWIEFGDGAYEGLPASSGSQQDGSTGHWFSGIDSDISAKINAAFPPDTTSDIKIYITRPEVTGYGVQEEISSTVTNNSDFGGYHRLAGPIRNALTGVSYGAGNGPFAQASSENLYATIYFV